MNHIFSHGGRDKYFPCKFKKDRAGDCVIRSISIATGIDYMEVWNNLFSIGQRIGHLPNSEKTYHEYLTSLGWGKHKPMRKPNGRKYKLSQAPFDKTKNYIVTTSGHMTAVVGGNVHDIWDCRDWCGNSYYTRAK